MREQIVIALRRYAETIRDAHKLHGRVSDSPKRLHHRGTEPADHGMLFSRNDSVYSARKADHRLAVQRLDGAVAASRAFDTMMPEAKIAAWLPSRSMVTLPTE